MNDDKQYILTLENIIKDNNQSIKMLIEVTKETMFKMDIIIRNLLICLFVSFFVFGFSVCFLGFKYLSIDYGSYTNPEVNTTQIQGNNNASDKK